MYKKKSVYILVTVVIAVLITTIGFFTAGCSKKAGETIGKSESREKILYWTCGMHPSVRSEKPGKCPICGMDLIPVYAESAQSASVQPGEKTDEAAYYGCGVKEDGHCPHCDGGKDAAECICGGHSFVMKDKEMSCPVCGKQLKKLDMEEIKRIDKSVVSKVALKKAQIELAGVVTEPVGKYHVTKTIRTVGKIAFDPELAVAEEEFLNALKTREKLSQSPDPGVIERADDLVTKSKLKLKLMGISDAQIKEIEDTKTTEANLVLPGETSWVYADIYEYDIAWIKEGQEARVIAVAFPGEEFKGNIKSINPVLDPNTRSVKVRLEVQNPEKKLRPEMYVDVVIESMYVSPDGKDEVLAVPREALLDTGVRKIVYVAAGEGKFLGKDVLVGPEGLAVIEGSETRVYPILGGLSEGEIIVKKGNFLIDSQSQLTGGMSALWGGAQEIKEEPSGGQPGASLVETKHRH